MADETNVGEATYVLQRRVSVTTTGESQVSAPEDGATIVEMEVAWSWVDLCEVTVPARTKRQTVLQRGLEQAGLTATGATAPLAVRVLSSESAEVFTLEPDPQPARWKVAGS